MRKCLFICIGISVALSACTLSFKGISIPDEAKTFYIENFDLNANSAPATLHTIFVEALRDKIQSESPLTYTDEDPDINFSGAIRSFRVQSIAPEPGEQTALNKLEIVVQINYENANNEDDNWTSNFSFFSNFPSDQNLLTVQDQLIDEINEQLVEDIFNRAFTNW